MPFRPKLRRGGVNYVELWLKEAELDRLYERQLERRIETEKRHWGDDVGAVFFVLLTIWGIVSAVYFIVKAIM